LFFAVDVVAKRGVLTTQQLGCFLKTMKAEILRACVAAVLCAYLSVVVFAQSAEQEILRAEQARIEARINRNADAASRLMSADFLQIDRLGNARTKIDVLKEYGAGITSIRDATVKVFGDTAVVTGVGKGPRQELRFLHVWHREDGQWLATFVQNTPITAAIPELLIAGAKPIPIVWREGRTPDERKLIKTQRTLNKAFAAGDVNTYDKLTADNFVDVGPQGNVTERPDFLNNLMKNKGQTQQISNSELYLRVYGQTAIVSFNGTPLSRMTHFFVKRKDHWKQLFRQTTPILSSGT
jgi:hypothetical protein